MPRTTLLQPNLDRASRQHGASLITVMLILIVVSALGIGAAQVAMMGERSARNDRDLQVAWQAAESTLMDAQLDIIPPLAAPPAASRSTVFGQPPDIPPVVDAFKTPCGTTSTSVGLCNAIDLAVDAKPPWLTTNFTASDSPTTAFGQFTNQTYPSGSGVRSARAPRYLVELIADPNAGLEGLDKTKKSFYMFRVTAMGFGPREDIRAVAQMLLRP